MSVSSAATSSASRLSRRRTVVIATICLCLSMVAGALPPASHAQTAPPPRSIARSVDAPPPGVLRSGPVSGEEAAASGWLQARPEAGRVEDEIVAYPDGTAAKAVASGPNRLTIEPAATTAETRLQVSPEYLQFAQTASGLLPAVQPLKIATSTGDPISFIISENIPWLSLAAGSGTAGATPFTTQVNVNPSGLSPAGSPYTGQITVANQVDPADVRTIQARLSVTGDYAFATLTSFDAAGNLQRRIKPDGVIVDYEFDAVGRLAAVRYPDGSSVTYEYDGNGNRTRMTDAHGTTQYVYDAKNRLTAVYFPSINPVEYGYDHAGNLKTLTYPDGRAISYTYDAGNRMTAVNDSTGTTSYTYDATTGRLASQTLPNGVKTTYGYDADGRLTDVTHQKADSSLLMAFHYTLDANGMRTAVRKDTPTGSETTSYVYDELLRLSQVSYPDGRVLIYTYDALGNRLRLEDSVNGVIDYVYDSDNRLLRAGAETFEYDASGNTIRRTSPTATIEYAWDAENRLVRYDDGQHVVEFEYDGDGNRVAKSVDDVRTNHINDVSGAVTQVLLTATEDWYVDQEYTYGLDRLGLNDFGSTNWRYYLQDSPRRSVSGVTGTSGTLVASAAYDAFGSPLGAPNPGDQPFAYNGESFDGETGLVFLRHRYYDPTLGRFLSKDAIGSGSAMPGMAHSYTYAANNTPNFVDPTGLWLDTVADVGFAVLDVGEIIKDPTNWVNWAALGADVALALVPIGTGGGIAVRALAKGDDYVRVSQKLGKLGEYFVTARKGIEGGYQQIHIGDRIADVWKGSEFIEIKNAAKIDARSVNQITDYFRSGATSGELATRTGTKLPARLQSLADEGMLKVSRAFDDAGSPLWSYGRSYSGQGAGYLWGQFMNRYGEDGDLGGVSLNRTAELLLEIDDLTGATYDPQTGQIVLYGKQDVALPQMNMDDLAVAVHSVFGGEDPGVSIDPPLVNNNFSVRYEGQTPETEFGWIMFEADRVMKTLALGRDNITGQPVTSNVPGYQSMLTRELASGDCDEGSSNDRFWFQPKEVKLVRSADGQSMLFDSVVVELLTEFTFEGGIPGQEMNPEAEAFAAHFSQHYDEFAQEFPVFKDLKRLAKVVGVIKWIRDNNIPIDLGFVDNYAVTLFDTPETTPATTVQGSNSTCTITIQGGVAFTPPNEYLADDPVDPVTDAMAEAAIDQRSSEEDFLWTFQPPPQALKAGIAGLTAEVQTAVAETFDRSRKDGNLAFAETDLSYPVNSAFDLELTRYYDSFSDQPGAFGPGWYAAPFALRFPRDKQTFTFGSGGVSLDLYATIWAADHLGGREDRYTLLGIDAANNAAYRRPGSWDTLWALTDGPFVLVKDQDTEVWFDAAGRLLSTIDRNENAVDYLYDANGRLVRLEEPGGRAIQLGYDTSGRISHATGAGGRLVTYAYDAAGSLHTVTDTASQTRTFTYDGEHRLSGVFDEEDDQLLNAYYDDYDRMTSGQAGSVADFSQAFNLANQTTETVDPYGGTNQKTFDDQYRLVAYVDPLQNRSEITYAGDFGPQLITDARGGVTELVYDAYGNVIVTFDATAERTDLWYDGYDRLLATRDPEGVENAFAYDANHNLTTVYHNVTLVLDANGQIESWYYDPNNLTTFAYGADGHLEGTTDPLGHTTGFGYDPNGQLAVVSSPGSPDTSMAYDSRARLDSVESGGSAADLAYDNADNLVGIATAAGGVSFGHDATGRLTALTDAESHATSFTYDPDGNLAQVLDAASGATAYAYDALGNLTGADLPNGTSAAYEYDELGRLAVAYTGKVVAPAAPEVTGSAAGGVDVRLAWTHAPQHTRYAVWRSASPYFTPGDASSTLIAEVAPPAGGGPGVYIDEEAAIGGGKYYFIVAYNIAHQASAPSNPLGGFPFALVPGKN